MPSHHDYGVDNETFAGGTPDDDPHVMTPTAGHSPGPQTHEEARQFHEGYLAGATAYAAFIGHGTLKSNNTTLAKLMDEQGWRTIETFEKVAAAIAKATEAPK